MSISKVLDRQVIQKIGKRPVVVLPLETWREIEGCLEDLKMSRSETFRKNIAKARKEKKVYSSLEVKRLLGRRL